MSIAQDTLVESSTTTAERTRQICSPASRLHQSKGLLSPLHASLSNITGYSIGLDVKCPWWPLLLHSPQAGVMGFATPSRPYIV